MNARQRTIPKLRESMEMAGFNLLNILSPAYDYMPLWNIKIDRETKRARCKMDYPAHNIGRWWGRDAAGCRRPPALPSPAALEEAMLENLERCLANPLSICGLLLPLEHRPPGWADEHSQREILLALAGLVRWRGSRWAADQGEKLVRALDRYIQEDGHWNYAMMVDLARKAGLQVDGEYSRAKGEKRHTAHRKPRPRPGRGNGVLRGDGKRGGPGAGRPAWRGFICGCRPGPTVRCPNPTFSTPILCSAPTAAC